MVYRFVKEPLMPKGVEHWIVLVLVPPMMGVKEPLMPKGVEHSALGRSSIYNRLSERTFDAERR